jgi:hypothetical protein
VEDLGPVNHLSMNTHCKASGDLVVVAVVVLVVVDHKCFGLPSKQTYLSEDSLAFGLQAKLSKAARRSERRILPFSNDTVRILLLLMPREACHQKGLGRECQVLCNRLRFRISEVHFRLGIVVVTSPFFFILFFLFFSPILQSRNDVMFMLCASELADLRG